MAKTWQIISCNMIKYERARLVSCTDVRAGVCDVMQLDFTLQKAFIHVTYIPLKLILLLSANLRSNSQTSMPSVSPSYTLSLFHK